MRHAPIDPRMFVDHRRRLMRLLPAGAMAVVNANDVMPTNADGTMPLAPNSDLFYLTGIEQEESVLVLFPQAADPRHRQILFLRQPSEHLKIWEGHKHTTEEAQGISGIKTVRWLSDFPALFRSLMCDAQSVWLNTNEHRRSTAEVQTRDDRFIAWCRAAYPLHRYERLAPLMHGLRLVKSPGEIELIRRAVEITERGFRRAMRFVKPVVAEHEVEAELAHEFTRRRGKFAFEPILACGANACTLHYHANDQTCRAGELLLMDVAASYGNYNADVTRTIPVSGRFTPRQRAVYDAVLRVMRASIAEATVGMTHRQWTRQAQQRMNDELLRLKLITRAELRKQTPDAPACRKHFMHGLGHPLGLDVHDVGDTNQPFAAGWVLTVEPGIYIPKEKIGVRLENDVLVTEQGPVDLTAQIPVEAAEVEAMMRR